MENDGKRANLTLEERWGMYFPALGRAAAFQAISRMQTRAKEGGLVIPWGGDMGGFFDQNGWKVPKGFVFPEVKGVVREEGPPAEAEGERGTMLERLERDAEKLHDEYMRCVGSESEKVPARERWQKAVEAVQRARTAAVKQGDMVPKAEVLGAFSRFMAAFPAMLENRLARVMPRERAREAIREAWPREVPEILAAAAA
jgi:hypothetical protein